MTQYFAVVNQLIVLGSHFLTENLEKSPTCCTDLDVTDSANGFIHYVFEFRGILLVESSTVNHPMRHDQTTMFASHTVPCALSEQIPTHLFQSICHCICLCTYLCSKLKYSSSVAYPRREQQVTVFVNLSPFNKSGAHKLFSICSTEGSFVPGISAS